MDVPQVDFTPTLPVFVRRVAAQFGDADFIVTPTERLSYAEAERTSRRLAKELLARGMGKGTRVGLMFGNGIEWIVTWLAVCRIGAIAMPFATTYRPAELRKALLLGDADTIVLPASLMGHDQLSFVEEAVPGLSEASVTGGVGGAAGGVVASGPVGGGAGGVASGPVGRALRLPSVPFLRHVLVAGGCDRPWAEAIDLRIGQGTSHPEIDEAMFEAVEGEVHPADHMLVVFTSGTTAEPKGVIHTHGTWVRYASNTADCNDVRAGQRTVAGMPLFWIGGVSHSVAPAMQRGNALLCTEKFDPEGLAELMVREQATDLAMWPGMAQRLAEQLKASGRDVSSVPAFASPLPVSPVRGMGMTETNAAYMASGPRDHVIPEEYAGAYGFPVPYLQYRFVDAETGAPIPDGEDGEICVRGYSLMAGMCKRERHEVFEDDGFYRTGDKGYRRGPYFWLTGRVKDLIKTAGANVAPREVEVLLDAQPEVLMSVVIGLPDEERGEIVGAVLVPASGAAVDAGEIVRRVSPDLSSYKVPRRVIVVPEVEMPYLSTGKPDRAALRDLLIDKGEPLNPR